MTTQYVNLLPVVVRSVVAEAVWASADEDNDSWICGPPTDGVQSGLLSTLASFTRNI